MAPSHSKMVGVRQPKPSLGWRRSMVVKMILFCLVLQVTATPIAPPQPLAVNGSVSNNSTPLTNSTLNSTLDHAAITNITTYFLLHNNLTGLPEEAYATGALQRRGFGSWVKKTWHNIVDTFIPPMNTHKKPPPPPPATPIELPHIPDPAIQPGPMQPDDIELGRLENGLPPPDNSQSSPPEQGPDLQPEELSNPADVPGTGNPSDIPLRGPNEPPETPSDSGPCVGDDCGNNGPQDYPESVSPCAEGNCDVEPPTRNPDPMQPGDMELGPGGPLDNGLPPADNSQSAPPEQGPGLEPGELGNPADVPGTGNPSDIPLNDGAKNPTEAPADDAPCTGSNCQDAPQAPESSRPPPKNPEKFPCTGGHDCDDSYPPSEQSSDPSENYPDSLGPCEGGDCGNNPPQEDYSESDFSCAEGECDTEPSDFDNDHPNADDGSDMANDDPSSGESNPSEPDGDFPNANDESDMANDDPSSGGSDGGEPIEPQDVTPREAFSKLNRLMDKVGHEATGTGLTHDTLVKLQDAMQDLMWHASKDVMKNKGITPETADVLSQLNGAMVHGLAKDAAGNPITDPVLNRMLLQPKRGQPWNWKVNKKNAGDHQKVTPDATKLASAELAAAAVAGKLGSLASQSPAFKQLADLAGHPDVFPHLKPFSDDKDANKHIPGHDTNPLQALADLVKKGMLNTDWYKPPAGTLMDEIVAHTKLAVLMGPHLYAAAISVGSIPMKAELLTQTAIIAAAVAGVEVVGEGVMDAAAILGVSIPLKVIKWGTAGLLSLFGVAIGTGIGLGIWASWYHNSKRRFDEKAQTLVECIGACEPESSHRFLEVGKFGGVEEAQDSKHNGHKTKTSKHASSTSNDRAFKQFAEETSKKPKHKSTSLGGFAIDVSSTTQAATKTKTVTEGVALVGSTTKAAQKTKTITEGESGVAMVLTHSARPHETTGVAILISDGHKPHKTTGAAILISKGHRSTSSRHKSHATTKPTGHNSVALVVHPSPTKAPKVHTTKPHGHSTKAQHIAPHVTVSHAAHSIPKPPKVLGTGSHRHSTKSGHASNNAAGTHATHTKGHKTSSHGTAILSDTTAHHPHLTPAPKPWSFSNRWNSTMHSTSGHHSPHNTTISHAAHTRIHNATSSGTAVLSHTAPHHSHPSAAPTFWNSLGRWNLTMNSTMVHSLRTSSLLTGTGHIASGYAPTGYSTGVRAQATGVQGAQVWFPVVHWNSTMHNSSMPQTSFAPNTTTLLSATRTDPSDASSTLVRSSWGTGAAMSTALASVELNDTGLGYNGSYHSWNGTGNSTNSTVPHRSRVVTLPAIELIIECDDDDDQC